MKPDSISRVAACNYVSVLDYNMMPSPPISVGERVKRKDPSPPAEQWPQDVQCLGCSSPEKQ